MREIQIRLPGGTGLIVNALGHDVQRMSSDVGIAIAIEVPSEEPETIAMVAHELEQAAAELRGDAGGNRPKGW